MIPRIAQGGRSFKGAYAYYGFDVGATTRDRVAWTHTRNVLTDDPDKAWKVLAYTAKHAERLKEASGQRMTGRKLTKPVFAYSLSWHPEQSPERRHMIEAAEKSLEVLGLSDHEAILIAHQDQPQKHVHILVNRCHWQTGLVADTNHTKRKLSDFAREYEREHGKVYCRQREENYQKRQQGEKTVYRDPKIVEAWKQADNGQGFAAALQDKGYQLAQGRKRLVVLDPYGQTHNPVRHLENVRANQFQERLKDLDLASLPDATQLSREIQAVNLKRYEESLQHDEWAAQQLSRLQDRHLEQRAHHSQGSAERLRTERAQLEQQYRLQEQENAIQDLRAKTKQPSWWKRLLGIARRELARLAELEKNYQNAQWRKQERLDHLARERERSLARLQSQQAAEQRRELTRIRTQMPVNYANENERQKIREHLPHVRAGPSLKR